MTRKEKIAFIHKHKKELGWKVVLNGDDNEIIDEIYDECKRQILSR